MPVAAVRIHPCRQPETHPGTLFVLETLLELGDESIQDHMYILDWCELLSVPLYYSIEPASRTSDFAVKDAEAAQR